MAAAGGAALGGGLAAAAVMEATAGDVPGEADGAVRRVISAADPRASSPPKLVCTSREFVFETPGRFAAVRAGDRGGAAAVRESRARVRTLSAVWGVDGVAARVGAIAGGETASASGVGAAAGFASTTRVGAGAPAATPIGADASEGVACGAMTEGWEATPATAVDAMADAGIRPTTATLPAPAAGAA